MRQDGGLSRVPYDAKRPGFFPPRPARRPSCGLTPSQPSRTVPCADPCAGQADARTDLHYEAVFLHAGHCQLGQSQAIAAPAALPGAPIVRRIVFEFARRCPSLQTWPCRCRTFPRVTPPASALRFGASDPAVRRFRGMAHQECLIELPRLSPPTARRPSPFGRLRPAGEQRAGRFARIRRWSQMKVRGLREARRRRRESSRGSQIQAPCSTGRLPDCRIPLRRPRRGRRPSSGGPRSRGPSAIQVSMPFRLTMKSGVFRTRRALSHEYGIAWYSLNVSRVSARSIRSCRSWITHIGSVEDRVARASVTQYPPMPGSATRSLRISSSSGSEKLVHEIPRSMRKLEKISSAKSLSSGKRRAASSRVASMGWLRASSWAARATLRRITGSGSDARCEEQIELSVVEFARPAVPADCLCDGAPSTLVLGREEILDFCQALLRVSSAIAESTTGNIGSRSVGHGFARMCSSMRCARVGRALTSVATTGPGSPPVGPCTSRSARSRATRRSTTAWSLRVANPALLARSVRGAWPPSFGSRLRGREPIVPSRRGPRAPVGTRLRRAWTPERVPLPPGSALSA